MSAIGLGCRNFGTGRSLDFDAAAAVVAAAIDSGITLFDTAASYGDGTSERILGRALGRHRADVVLATKIGGPRARREGTALGSRSYIRRAVDQSLTRLGTDYIDLLQLHVPDEITPPDETLSALDDLVRQGKILYAGSSNYAAWMLAEAALTSRLAHTTRLVSAQYIYNLIERGIEPDVIDVCRRYDVALLAARPLFNGVLAKAEAGGGPAAQVSPRDEAVLKTIAEYAAELGVSPAEVALGLTTSLPAVTSALVSASHPDQVRANARSLEWTQKAAVAEVLASLDAIDGSRSDRANNR